MSTKKIFSILILLNLIGFYLIPQPIFAEAGSCTGIQINTTPAQPTPEGQGFTITFKGIDVTPASYSFRIGFGHGPGDLQVSTTHAETSADRSVTLSVSDSNVLSRGSHIGTLLKDGQDYCGNVDYKVGYDFSDCQMSFNPNPVTNKDFQIVVNHAPAGTWHIYTTNNFVRYDPYDKSTSITVGSDGKGTSQNINYTSLQTINLALGRAEGIGLTGLGEINTFWCGNKLSVVPDDGSNRGSGGNGGGGGGTGGIDCSKPENKDRCSQSAGLGCNVSDGSANPSGGDGVLTAIGCIPTTPKVLLSKLMGFAAGIGGGIALLLMIFGAFQMMTSAGNPESIKKGRDQFIAAAIGLLFILFSALLLRIIGVDFLNIPGFS